MALHKVADVIVFQDEGYYCGPGPSVVAFPDGDVAVFFRRHRSWTGEPLVGHYHPTTEQCIIGSPDGAHTWEVTPRVFMGGGQCPCVTLLRDGALLFVTHRWEIVPEDAAGAIPGVPGMQLKPWPHVCAGTESWRSTDRGLTWEGPFWVEEVPGLVPLAEGLHPPVSIRGWAVELRDAAIVLPVYARVGGSLMFVSTDGGRTWRCRSLVAECPAGQPVGYNEWSAYETDSGELVAFIRCDLPADQGGGYLHAARSSDGGRTWSEPRREDLWGHPFHALRMPSGRVLLSYGHRRAPFGVRCRLIDPECRRPDEAQELVLREDGGGFDLGYPHAALLPDGRALVAYYFHEPENGQRYVAASVVEER